MRLHALGGSGVRALRGPGDGIAAGGAALRRRRRAGERRHLGLRARLRRGAIDRYSLEKRLLRPDGSVVWVVSTFQRRDYPDGTLQEISTIVEITELRRIRELSEREQARLRFILDSMPVGVSSAILEFDVESYRAQDARKRGPAEAGEGSRRGSRARG